MGVFHALLGKDPRTKSLSGKKDTYFTVGKIAVAIGLLVTLYGVAFGVVKNYQFRPLSYQRRATGGMMEWWEKGQESLIKQATNLENSVRKEARSAASERALHIIIVGGLIMIAGYGFVRAAINPENT